MPIGGGEMSSGANSIIVAPMVTSVGPYPLHMRSPGRIHLRTSSEDSSSPAEISTRWSGNCSPVSRLRTAGGRQAKVTRLARISAASRGGDSSVWRLPNTASPPEHIARNMSIADTSKFSDANCRNRSRSSSGQCATMPWTKLTTLRCSTITPFGRPVEPEV